MKSLLTNTMPVIVVACLALVSCGDEEKKMGQGFRLPEGNATDGQIAFTELNCHQCHSVKGVAFPEAPDKSAVHFALGGEVRFVKSYGELVTAIIRPQHVVTSAYRKTLEKEERELARSPMPDYNEVMTVGQMADLVTFLRSHYSKAAREYHDYDTFHYYSP